MFATAAATVVVVVVVVAAALVAVDVLGTSALTMLLKLMFVKIHICKQDINQFRAQKRNPIPNENSYFRV